MNDIRWIQRFRNYKKAMQQLTRFVEKYPLSEMEEQGLIQAFEYTFELAWKTLQDLLEHIGYKEVKGPRPVLQQAFQDGYIKAGETWMDMLLDRNRTSHTYNEEIAQAIARAVVDDYYPLLAELQEKLEDLKRKA